MQHTSLSASPTAASGDGALAACASAAGVIPWTWGIVADGTALPGGGAFDGVHPDDLPALLRARDAALAGNGRFAAEYRVGADGARREARGRVRRAEDGTAEAIVGVSFDAPRPPAPPPLLDEGEQYRALFTDSPTAKWIWDPATLAILDANQAACERYGYTRDEFLRVGVLDLRPADDREAARRDIAGGPASRDRVPVRHQTRDGTLLDVEVTVRAVSLAGGGTARLASVHDLTPQRAAAQAARVSDAMFHAAVDHSLAGFYMVRNRRIVYANPRACEILGYTLEETYALDDISKLPVPEERDRVSAFIARRESGGEQVHYATRLRRGDGSVADVEIFGSSIEIDGERVIIATILDVTERVRTDRALREAEAQFRAVFEDAGVGIALVDPHDGRTLRSNAALQRMLGYTARELAAATVPSLTHPADRDVDQELFREVLAGVRPSYEIEKRYIRKDGTVVWGRLTTSLVRDPDGAVRFGVGMVQDVTARKEAEAALRETLARFRQLTDHLGAAYYLTDVEPRQVRYVSPGFEAIWGVPVSEAYGNPRAWMERVHPDDRHAARTARGPGRECAPMQYRIVRPDGQVRWISDRAFPVYDDDGRLFRLAGVAEDVTERRRVEQALYESEERYRAILRHYPDSAVFLFDQELRFLVAEGEALAAAGNDPSRVVGRRLRECVPPAMADALEPMYRAALRGEERTFPLTLGEREYDCRALPLRDADGQVIAGLVVARDVSEQRRHDAVRQALEAQLRQSQKMEAVGRLAGGIAHDFNNILTVITANAEFLLEALDPADPRHADTVEIRAAAARAAALTRQLLAFSRKQILSPQVLDLNRVVEAVRPMLARLIGEDVRVETRAAPELPAVLADAGQMEQVLLNLAVNARDAMPGGGRLYIETAECRVDDGTWADAAPDDPRREVPPGAYVTLAMSDTGTGMPPEVAARVFEPFFTTKPLGRGTGLGLSTVYGIVTQSGGHVCVHSVPGEGSTFTLFLPRVSSAPCAAAAAPAAPAPARGSESVLLVEDEEVVRTLARRTLERQGYTVIEALGAEHAVALAAAYDGPIHLLLTDVVMPEMAGPALVEHLHGERPLLPVLYMSGYTDDEIVRRGVLTSETPFLQKPFTPAALVSAVREVLDRAA